MSQKASLIVNGAGAVAALIVAGWIGISWLDRDEPAICEGRYAVSTRLDLTTASGRPVALSELQARLGSSEWGLLENASVLEPESGQKFPALAVTLRKGTGAGYKTDQTRGGIGFTWLPAEMRGAAPKAACLSYRLFFPEDFNFAAAGTLPGLSIGAAFDPRAEPAVGSGAAVRAGWNKEGSVFVSVQYAAEEGWKSPFAVSSKRRWPTGRWVNVEQEVILNDPGKKNGIVRIWLDGELAGENKKVGLRGDETLSLAGVRADVNYGSVTSNSEAPKDTEIRMTPFAVRWQ